MGTKEKWGFVERFQNFFPRIVREVAADFEFLIRVVRDRCSAADLFPWN